VEISKEVFSLVCEENYNNDDVRSALAKGYRQLISLLRTKNMFPVELYANKLAESIADIYKDDDKQSVKLFFDDAASFSKDQEDLLNLEDVEDKGPDPDKLLDDDDFDNSKILKNNFSIKVADDDLDVDDGEIDFEEEA
jgi:hypothetical protein